MNKIQNIENSLKLLQLEYFPSIMDERVHKARLADLKKEVVKVYLRIDNLTANDVTMGDRDTYRTDQAETRKLFTVTREHLYDLIDELDDDDPTDQARTTVVKGIDKKLTDKFKENDEAVKERMVELIKEFESTKPLAASEKSNFSRSRFITLTNIGRSYTKSRGLT